VYDSATLSIYLDPSLGPNNSPESFPPGTITFGGVDRSLFNGKFTTLPIVLDNSTTVTSVPQHWSIALGEMKLGSSKENLVQTPGGEGCVITPSANIIALRNGTFFALGESFPQAKFNSANGLFEIDCSERDRSENTLSFTFVDPRNPKDNSFTFKIPPAETIWPTDRIVPGGDPKTCAIAGPSSPPCVYSTDC
jgi:hypothetical protein